MAISYPRALPTHTGIRNITLRAVNVTAVSQSVFTLRQQIYKHTGERWEAEIKLPAMARASAEQWVAWLLSMRGREGTFLLGDPVGKTPRGSAGGTPVVNGAGQTGDSISIDGCTASQTGWLKAGDYIQLGSGASASLHKVLQDVSSSWTSGRQFAMLRLTMRRWSPARRKASSGCLHLALSGQSMRSRTSALYFRQCRQ